MFYRIEYVKVHGAIISGNGNFFLLHFSLIQYRKQCVVAIKWGEVRII